MWNVKKSNLPEPLLPDHCWVVFEELSGIEIRVGEKGKTELLGLLESDARTLAESLNTMLEVGERNLKIRTLGDMN